MAVRGAAAVTRRMGSRGFIAKSGIGLVLISLTLHDGARKFRRLALQQVPRGYSANG